MEHIQSRLPAAESSPQTERPLLVIKPSSGWAALNLQDVWRYRDLMWSFASRDIKLRYRQTVLGVGWVVFQPLIAAGIFSFVFGAVAKLPSDGVPYFLFSYAGLLGWNLFSNVFTKVSGCLVQNGYMLSKVYFPRLVLPFSTLWGALLDWAVSAVLMGVLMVVYGVAPGWGLLLLPVWMLIILGAALGLGMLVASLTPAYRDVLHLLPVFVQLLLYASPVAYALSAIPSRFQSWYLLNPLVAMLEAFRWSLLGRGSLPITALAYATVVSGLLFVAGAFLFRRMERKFADVI